MEKKAREFLDLTATLYEKNKEKWSGLLKSVGLVFDEDIYNDTIIKVYDKMMADEETDQTTEDELIGYWYQSFKNNIMRNKQYSYNSKRDDCDVIDLLKNEEYIITTPHITFTTIRYLLNKVKEEYNQKDYHLFKMYYLTTLTYDELSLVVGYDAKSKINKMKNWLKQNV